MAAPHRVRVVFVKGAALLVDHDAVLAERVETDAVKFAGKIPFERTERVRRIDDDEVVIRVALSQKAERIVVIDMYAPVVQLAGVLGQKGAADLDDLRVHLDEIDLLHALVARQFAHHATVSRADDENVAHAGVHGHGDVRDHLVVDELVALRQHDVAVQREHPAEFRRLKDIDLLIAAALRIQMPVHADAVLDVRRMKFAEPQFHGDPPTLIR